MRAPVVSVLIDLPADHRYHRASLRALRHAADHLRMSVEIRAVTTDAIRTTPDLTTQGSAILVGPGSPYRDPDAVVDCIGAARKNGVPLVGT